MKSPKGLKAKVHENNGEDALRKPAKLEPARKSGKEKHALYGDFDESELEEDFGYRKRESVLDYFDDGEEE